MACIKKNTHSTSLLIFYGPLKKSNCKTATVLQWKLITRLWRCGKNDDGKNDDGKNDDDDV